MMMTNHIPSQQQQHRTHQKSNLIPSPSNLGYGPVGGLTSSITNHSVSGGGGDYSLDKNASFKDHNNNFPVVGSFSNQSIIGGNGISSSLDDHHTATASSFLDGLFTNRGLLMDGYEQFAMMRSGHNHQQQQQQQRQQHQPQDYHNIHQNGTFGPNNQQGLHNVPSNLSMSQLIYTTSNLAGSNGSSVQGMTPGQSFQPSVMGHSIPHSIQRQHQDSLSTFQSNINPVNNNNDNQNNNSSIQSQDQQHQAHMVHGGSSTLDNQDKYSERYDATLTMAPLYQTVQLTTLRANNLSQLVFVTTSHLHYFLWAFSTGYSLFHAGFIKLNNILSNTTRPKTHQRFNSTTNSTPGAGATLQQRPSTALGNNTTPQLQPYLTATDLSGASSRTNSSKNGPNITPQLQPPPDTPLLQSALQPPNNGRTGFFKGSVSNRTSLGRSSTNQSK